MIGCKLCRVYLILFAELLNNVYTSRDFKNFVLVDYFYLVILYNIYDSNYLIVCR